MPEKDVAEYVVVERAVVEYAVAEAEYVVVARRY